MVNDVYCWAWIILDLGSMENKEFYCVLGSNAYQFIDMGLLDPKEGDPMLILNGSFTKG